MYLHDMATSDIRWSAGISLNLFIRNIVAFVKIININNHGVEKIIRNELKDAV